MGLYPVGLKSGINFALEPEKTFIRDFTVFEIYISLGIIQLTGISMGRKLVYYCHYFVLKNKLTKRNWSRIIKVINKTAMTVA